jgi:hypothetical protein
MPLYSKTTTSPLPFSISEGFQVTQAGDSSQKRRSIRVLRGKGNRPTVDPAQRGDNGPGLCGARWLGIAPAHIAGWSEGGIVGLGLALDYPGIVRSLVGIVTNYTNAAKTVAQLATLDPDDLQRANPAAATMLAQRHDLHHRPRHWKLSGSSAKMTRGSISTRR